MDQLTVKISRGDLPPRVLRLSTRWVDHLARWLWLMIGVTVTSLTLSGVLGWRLFQKRNSPVSATVLAPPVAQAPQPIASPLAQATPASETAASEAAMPVNLPPQEFKTQTASNPFELGSVHRLRSIAATTPANLRFRLDPIQLQRAGKKIKLRSSLSYIATDGGKQEGRIWILAYGPNHLSGYPDGVLDSGRGETFSVSRFRAIEADLDLGDPALFREIWVVIADPQSHVLVARRTGL